MLTSQRLKEVLAYDPATGKFTRLKNGSKAGAVRPDGYVQMLVDGRLYRASRLAWLYMTGNWPSHFIDHINGLPADNRLENLREATEVENHRNARVRSHNCLGLKGVQETRHGRYSARITYDGKIHRLGNYRTPAEAHRAYCAEAAARFGVFANEGGVPCQ